MHTLRNKLNLSELVEKTVSYGRQSVFVVKGREEREGKNKGMREAGDC